MRARSMLLTCAAVLVAGCGEGTTVDVPDSDGSPPHVKIGSAGLSPDVFTKTGGFAGDQPLAESLRATSPRDRGGLILATAEDEESGIASVVLRGELFRTCEQGDIGQRQHAVLYVPQTSPPGDSRPSRLATQYGIDPAAERRCNPGFQFVSAELRLRAEATNGVSGTRATQQVTIDLP